MISQFLQKTIAISVTLLFVAYMGYSLMNVPEDLSSIQSEFSESEVASQDILAIFDKLRRVSVDSSVFSSPLFSNLVDFSTAIIPEENGRPNPFAPIGVDQATAQTSVSNVSFININARP